MSCHAMPCHGVAMSSHLVSRPGVHVMSPPGNGFGGDTETFTAPLVPAWPLRQNLLCDMRNETPSLNRHHREQLQPSKCKPPEAHQSRLSTLPLAPIRCKKGAKRCACHWKRCQRATRGTAPALQKFAWWLATRNALPICCRHQKPSRSRVLLRHSPAVATRTAAFRPTGLHTKAVSTRFPALSPFFSFFFCRGVLAATTRKLCAETASVLNTILLVTRAPSVRWPLSATTPEKCKIWKAYCKIMVQNTG